MDFPGFGSNKWLVVGSMMGLVLVGFPNKEKHFPAGSLNVGPKTLL